MIIIRHFYHSIIANVITVNRSNEAIYFYILGNFYFVIFMILNSCSYMLMLYQDMTVYIICFRYPFLLDYDTIFDPAYKHRKGKVNS